MLARSLSGAAKAGQVIGVEDVFSTWLYTGNGSTQTITNGIDLSGEGGLVWIKQRSLGNTHRLFDTLRGAEIALSSASTSGNTTRTGSLTAFNSDGFDLGNDSTTNGNGETHASWTFRKAEKFFDVVTYTGNGVAGRTIAHNLGSTPGCIIVKRLNVALDWAVYHRSTAATKYLLLNGTNAAITSSAEWNNTEPTASVFTVGTSGYTNNTGDSYVAYVFAHDAGGFGDSGNDSVVKCGGYTGNGSASGPTVDLGWEPQWLMLKRTSGAGGWYIYDNMRGVATGGIDANLRADSSGAEDASFDYLDFNSTGFKLTTSSNDHNGSGDTYIYIAIRRGPMKTPTDATKVFKDLAYTANGAADRSITGVGFPPDLIYGRKRVLGGYALYDRLRGPRRLLDSATTSAEFNIGAGAEGTLGQDGFIADGAYGLLNYPNGTNEIVWSFRRAPSFFDVVAYTGTGVARTVSHNLGVAPELMIIKSRSNGTLWMVYASALGNGSAVRLDTDGALFSFTNIWNSTSPTSTEFTIGTNSNINTSAATYIAYLFATLPGISKVGSYTGTAATQQVDCGFTAGARFVLIKRTDSTGDWYVWDSARGIISGNDPYLLLNSTAAEVTGTDYIDPLSTGFEISSTAPAAINASGGSFIFLAIA